MDDFDARINKFMMATCAAIWICTDCGYTVAGKDLRVPAGTSLRFTFSPPYVEIPCVKCNGWNFERIENPFSESAVEYPS